MWSIDVRNLVQNKFILCREYHIQPSEIDRMLMFEYEYLIEDIKAYVKKQEEQQKEDEKNNKIPSMNNMMSQYKSSMSKISIPKL